MRRRLPPALRHRDFALYWSAMFASGVGMQMASVAVGWQVYAIHQTARPRARRSLRDPAAAAPRPPRGQLADRLQRRLVFAASLLLDSAVVGSLLALTLAGADVLWPYLLLAVGTGVASAVGAPAARALTPTLVPDEVVANAMAVRSVAFQAAIVGGPALGGALFAVLPELPFVVGLGLFAVAAVAVLSVRHAGRGARAAAPGLESLLAGISFVRRTPVILGSISLDLFAVLFGGAVALLPLYARTILDIGPVGLGVLRSAPAVGALLAALWITRRPLGRHAGRKLLVAVAVFGASMIVFGLSRSFALSALALAVSGVADMISMNVRATTVALATPEALRGRVNAVEMVFISASNELGASSRASRRRCSGRRRRSSRAASRRSRSPPAGRACSRRSPASTGSRSSGPRRSVPADDAPRMAFPCLRTSSTSTSTRSIRSWTAPAGSQRSPRARRSSRCRPSR